MHGFQLFAFIAALRFIDAADVTAENRLAKDLLQNYDTKIRPVLDPTSVLKVQISVVLQSANIVETSSHGTLLFTMIKLNMVWKDELIHWNPADYEGITVISFSDRKIWTPSVSVLYKSVPRVAFSYRTILMEVEETGNVTLMKQTEYIVPCKHNFEHWPQDRLSCRLRFYATDYPESVRLEFDDEDLTGESSLIIHSHTGEEFPSDWSPPTPSSVVCVDRNVTNANGQIVKVCDRVITLTFYRLTTSFFNNIFVPFFLLYVMAWLSIFINNEVLRLVFMGVSIIYHIRMIRLLWKAVKGSVNKDVVITHFFRNQIYLTVFMLAVTMISFSIKSMKTPPSQCLKMILNSSIAKLVLCTFRAQEASPQHFSLEREESQSNKTNNNANSWRVISLLIDRALIVTVPTLYVINYMVFYPNSDGKYSTV